METFREPIPCKFIDAGSTLRHSVRKAFGVPDGVDDLSFVNRLCFDVLKKSPGLPAAATEYSNALGQVPPVLVIDNVRSFHITDMDFLEYLYKACFAGRVLLYIFTDDEYIANMICSMNGHSRMRPLQGMFAIKKKSNWEIVEDSKAITGKIATGIARRAQRWKKSRLTGIVTACYSGFNWSDQKDPDGLLVFVEDGMLPDMALEVADKVMIKSASDEVLQMSTRIRNAKYDDVYDDGVYDESEDEKSVDASAMEDEGQDTGGS